MDASSTEQREGYLIPVDATREEHAALVAEHMPGGATQNYRRVLSDLDHHRPLGYDPFPLIAGKTRGESARAWADEVGGGEEMYRSILEGMPWS